MWRNLDTAVLRSFAMIAETGSFSRAGDVLHLTQSAISQQMRRLEQQLDKRLFEKHGRRMMLSDDGEQLLSYARRIIQLNDEVITRMMRRERPDAVRFGISEHLADTVLHQLMANWLQTSGDTVLDARTGLNHDLIEGTNSATLDVALIVRESGSEVASTVLEEPIVWVGESEAAVKAYDKLPIVVLNGPCMFRTVALTSLENHKIQWEVSYSASTLSSLKAAVRAGMGVSALLRSEVRDGLTVVQPPNLPALPRAAWSLRYAPERRIPLTEAVERLLRDMLQANDGDRASAGLSLN